MKIEKLAPSQRKKNRWLLWLDDGSLLRVGQNEMADFALHQGMELEPDMLQTLMNAAEEQKLKEKALSILSSRSLSRWELVQKLSAQPHRRTQENPDEEAEEKECAQERRRAMVDSVADRMEELGLLNDEEYAVQVVRHYASKGYGVRKIRNELYRRGVPRELWEDALEQLPDSADTVDALLEKKLRGWDGDPKELKRASDWLARRGFSWSDISAALRRYEREV